MSFLYKILPEYTKNNDVLTDSNAFGKVKTLEEFLSVIDKETFDITSKTICSILDFTDIYKIRHEYLPLIAYFLGYEWNSKIETSVQQDLLSNILKIYKRKGTEFSVHYRLYSIDPSVELYEPYKDIFIVGKSRLIFIDYFAYKDGLKSGALKSDEKVAKRLTSKNLYSPGILVIKMNTYAADALELVEMVRPAGWKILVECKRDILHSFHIKPPSEIRNKYLYENLPTFERENRITQYASRMFTNQYYMELAKIDGNIKSVFVPLVDQFNLDLPVEIIKPNGELTTLEIVQDLINPRLYYARYDVTATPYYEYDYGLDDTDFIGITTKSNISGLEVSEIDKLNTKLQDLVMYQRQYKNNLREIYLNSIQYAINDTNMSRKQWITLCGRTYMIRDSITSENMASISLMKPSLDLEYMNMLRQPFVWFSKTGGILENLKYYAEYKMFSPCNYYPEDFVNFISLKDDFKLKTLANLTNKYDVSNASDIILNKCYNITLTKDEILTDLPNALKTQQIVDQYFPLQKFYLDCCLPVIKKNNSELAYMFAGNIVYGENLDSLVKVNIICDPALSPSVEGIKYTPKGSNFTLTFNDPDLIDKRLEGIYTNIIKDNRIFTPTNGKYTCIFNNLLVDTEIQIRLAAKHVAVTLTAEENSGVTFNTAINNIIDKDSSLDISFNIDDNNELSDITVNNISVISDVNEV